VGGGADISAAVLFRRPRFRVCFYFSPLSFDDVPQLALHRLEGVMDHLRKRLVGAVVLLTFVGNKLVSPRNRHVDSHPVRISFVMRVVGLFDGNVATVDMIAKSLEPGGVIENKVINFIGFFHATISDLNRQLHT
jgi:hypothetical protein